MLPQRFGLWSICCDKATTPYILGALSHSDSASERTLVEMPVVEACIVYSTLSDARCAGCKDDGVDGHPDALLKSWSLHT